MSHLPVPGVRYTRATLVLRRPTACQRNWGTVSHALTFEAEEVTENGLGCWAACGCSASA